MSTLRLRLVFGGFTGVLFASALFFVTAPAGAATTTTMTMGAGTPANGNPGVALTAQLYGAAVAGVKVNFSIHLPEFSGSPLLLTGTTTTNAAGIATFVYQPTWKGLQSFVATAVDSSGTVVASASVGVNAARTDPFAGAVEAVRPDGVIGRWVVVALLALVIWAWFTLIAIVVRVRRGKW